MMDPPVNVTAIVVTWQSRGDIEGVLASIDAAFAAQGIAGSILVVDNASTDDTVAWLRANRPDVAVIEAPENEGFGRANNRAFEVAVGDVWLLVNPDARLGSDTIIGLIDGLRHEPRIGAVAARLSAPGEAESAGMLPSARSGAGHFLFLNRLLPGGRGGPWRGVQLRRQPPGRLVAVEWASAAVLALRPAAVRAIGGFDPTIFLYGEDVDFGARLGFAGWGIRLATDAVASHAIGGSSDPRSTRWLDGFDDAMVRAGRSRPSRMGFFATAAIGLLIRAAIARFVARGPGRRRSDRFLPGARRAAILAGRAVRH
jgi:N-acetylglucosaminyl-diphospho-decaprenol L-rhamnosyltransferase